MVVIGKNKKEVKDGFRCVIWQMEVPISEMRGRRGREEWGNK